MCRMKESLGFASELLYTGSTPACRGRNRRCFARVLRSGALGGSPKKFQNTYFRRHGGCLATATMSGYPTRSREARMPAAADNNKAHDRTDEIRSTRAPKLREDQIEVLKRYGQAKKAEVGEIGRASCRERV